MALTVPLDQIPKNLSGPEGDKYIADLEAGELTTANPPATVTTEPGEGSPGDGGEQPPSSIKIKKQRSASNRNNKFGQLRYQYAILEKETDYLQIEILKYKTLGITPQKDVLKQGLNSNKRNYNNTKNQFHQALFTLGQFF